MNRFAQSFGQTAASILDGAQDLLEDSYHATRSAGTAFARAYAEEHASNLRRRGARRTVREMRDDDAYTVITIHPAWEA